MSKTVVCHQSFLEFTELDIKSFVYEVWMIIIFVSNVHLEVAQIITGNFVRKNLFRKCVHLEIIQIITGIFVRKRTYLSAGGM